MRPADETAAFGCSEPQDSRTAHSCCQGQFSPHTSSGRAQLNEWKNSTADSYRVMILDESLAHAASLVDALQSNEISATAFQKSHDFLEALTKWSSNIAILVLHSRSWWQDELRLFCDSIRQIQKKPEPEILCILAWESKDAEEEAMDRVFGDVLRADVRHEW